MGLIDINKPLSAVLSSAIDKNQQHQEKNSWEHRELNQGLLGEKQVCFLCAMQPPSPKVVSYCRAWARGRLSTRCCRPTFCRSASRRCRDNLKQRNEFKWKTAARIILVRRRIPTLPSPNRSLPGWCEKGFEQS